MVERLYAAFAKVRITPEEPCRLSGYAFRTEPADPSRDVLDDLYAAAAVLDDGRRRAVLVSLDLCMAAEEEGRVPFPGRPGEYRAFPPSLPEGTRRAWAETAGAAPAAVFVCATHPHGGPAQLAASHADAVRRAIAEAAGRLEPVNVFAAEGASDLSAFRRPDLLPNRERAIDRTLRVLLFETVAGRPLGCLVNYAVHPTSLNEVYKISAEFVGLAMRKLEAARGDGFVSLFIQGFSGDVCPTFGGLRAGLTESSYPFVIEAADRLRADIEQALRRRTPLPSVPLRTEEREFRVPAREGLDFAELTVRLTGVRLGEAALIGVSGEVFNDYAGKMKALCAPRVLLTAGLVNGYCGYIPTRDAFTDGLGGYEIETTPFDERVEARVMECAREFLYELCEGEGR